MKFKEIKNMPKGEREKKLKELKMELVKSKAGSGKTGNSKAKQIRKFIARILTLNASKKEELKK
jgi:ribosomal protein L29